MCGQNRQCFFLTENHFNNGARNDHSLPWKNTRNYMNKMAVSEKDQFEICAIIPIHTGQMNRERKEEKKSIPRRIITKLSAMSGNVDVFVSGMKLLNMKYFPSDEGIGFVTPILSLLPHSGEMTIADGPSGRRAPF